MANITACGLADLGWLGRTGGRCPVRAVQCRAGNSGYWDSIPASHIIDWYLQNPALAGLFSASRAMKQNKTAELKGRLLILLL